MSSSNWRRSANFPLRLLQSLFRFVDLALEQIGNIRPTVIDRLRIDRRQGCGRAPRRCVAVVDGLDALEPQSVHRAVAYPESGRLAAVDDFGARTFRPGLIGPDDRDSCGDES